MGRSKRYTQAVTSIDRAKLYPIEEAVGLLKNMPSGKFDESVDLAINLGVDPKHADQMVRGAVVLPHGTGKSMRVLVFAKGDKEHEAREAGADHVGAEELAQKIQQEGWMDFDRVIAVGRAVTEQKAGKVEYRVDKNGIVHCQIGKISFDAGQLLENIGTLVDVIQKQRPASAKGTYFERIALSTTMGPGVRIEPQSAVALSAE